MCIRPYIALPWRHPAGGIGRCGLDELSRQVGQPCVRGRMRGRIARGSTDAPEPGLPGFGQWRGPMGTFARFLPPVAAIGAALALAGCSGGSLSSGWGFGGSDQPPQAEQPGPEIPATIRVSEVIGRWGYAAFHKPEDRQRTEA